MSRVCFQWYLFVARIISDIKPFLLLLALPSTMIESMIPEWMDLVVWGHEHECLITPQESLVGTFRISQPGSSVATSLTQGEGRQKHVGILDIRGQQFRLKSIPLGSVRGFAIGDVSLTELAEGGTVLDIEDPKVEERMGDVLAAEVENLVSYFECMSVELNPLLQS